MGPCLAAGKNSQLKQRDRVKTILKRERKESAQVGKGSCRPSCLADTALARVRPHGLLWEASVLPLGVMEPISPSLSFSVLVWAFPVVMAIVNCLDAGGCVI